MTLVGKEMHVESPIEDRMLGLLSDYLARDVFLEAQVDVRTRLGRFRLDFAISQQGRAIAVECDGKEFHNFFRDEIRDSAVLTDTVVDTIWRFSGPSIVHAAIGCMVLLCAAEPQLFGEDLGQRFKRALAEPVERLEWSTGYNSVPRPSDAALGSYLAYMRTRRPNVGGRQHWRFIAREIERNAVSSIDEYVSLSQERVLGARRDELSP